MTKSIETLIKDLNSQLITKGWFNEDVEKGFIPEITNRLRSAYGSGQEERKPTLRLSRMGWHCPRAVWASIHRPGDAEPLPPGAEFKYSFGHLIEGLTLALAKSAGHEVIGEQDELQLEGITGHRDCVIDGYTVDVKSAATISFNKYRSGGLNSSDTFGYRDQLSSYILAAVDDPKVKFKRKGFLLFVDKQLGHFHLHPHEVDDGWERTLRERAEAYKRIVEQASPPPCECGTLVHPGTGNVILDLKASYSDFKHFCHPHLRTFLYAKGPVFCTKVVKRPYNQDGPIKEVDRYGRTVYS